MSSRKRSVYTARVSKASGSLVRHESNSWEQVGFNIRTALNDTTLPTGGGPTGKDRVGVLKGTHISKENSFDPAHPLSPFPTLSLTQPLLPRNNGDFN